MPFTVSVRSPDRRHGDCRSDHPDLNKREILGFLWPCHGRVPAAVSTQAFFVKDYIVNHPEDGEKIGRLRELMFEQVRSPSCHASCLGNFGALIGRPAQAHILEYGLAVHEKFVPQDMRPLHKKLVDQFHLMKTSLGIQVGAPDPLARGATSRACLTASLRLSRSCPVTCAPVRCTSPTGARGPAGTPYRASSALTAVEGSRDAGDRAFVSSLLCLSFLSSFAPLRRSVSPSSPRPKPAAAFPCVCVLTCSLTPPLCLPGTFSPPSRETGQPHQPHLPDIFTSRVLICLCSFFSP